MRRPLSALACLLSIAGCGPAVATMPEEANGTAPQSAPQAGNAVDPNVATLSAGQYVQGDLAQGDAVASDGSFTDGVFVNAMTQSTTISVSSPSQTPLRALVTAPNGQPLSQSQNGVFVLPPGAIYRVWVIGAAPGATGQWVIGAQANNGSQVAGTVQTTHHAFTPETHAQQQASGSSQTLTIGAPLHGELAQGDATLTTGEFSDRFTFTGTASQTVTFRLTSSAFDAFLLIRSPDGQTFQNDDANGERNSAYTLTLPTSGEYTVVATSYRPGEAGAYEIWADLGARQTNELVAQTTTPSMPNNNGAGTQSGALGPGDNTLRSGEFTDSYEYQLNAGQTIQVRLTSTEFDPYVIIYAPNGTQQDNDDITQTDRNSGLDYTAPVTGTYRVVATSYRPGEQGRYTLVINGASGASGTTQVAANPTQPTQPSQPTGPSQAVATGGRVTGELAQGDGTLQSGEFADTHSITLTQGASVRLHLTSTAFDPYLVVHTPSGRQMDNDDMTPAIRDAAIEIPAAEAGTYRVVVTSYRPGERGAYNLLVEQGASIARPIDPGSPQNPAANPNQRGGRVFGVFAGISDYPGNGSDLTGCAEDAQGMAQTFEHAGLMNNSQFALLTNDQATMGNVRQAMQRFAREATPQDVFVFFYSGHGSRGAPGSSQDPNEVDGADESIVLYDGRLLDDEMGQMFDALHAQTSILALDSCFAGGFAKDVIRRPGRVGYFSSEEDVTSAVASQFQAGGYLSHFFKVGIEGEADRDPADSVLTVGELSHYLRGQFSQHASDVRMGAAYQTLVVDRGAVGSEVVLWAFRR